MAEVNIVFQVEYKTLWVSNRISNSLSDLNSHYKEGWQHVETIPDKEEGGIWVTIMRLINTGSNQ